MSTKKFINLFLPNNKFYWPSSDYNAGTLFRSNMHDYNLFDLLFWYYFMDDLDLTVFTKCETCYEIAEDRGHGGPYPLGEDLIQALGDAGCMEDIKEGFSKNILSTWCLDKAKFSAGIYIINSDFKENKAYGISALSIYHYILTEKYPYAMYMFLKDHNVLLIDKKIAIEAFQQHHYYIPYDREKEFETVFLPRLKLIWQVLQLPTEKFLYIQENKIFRTSEIGYIMNPDKKKYLEIRKARSKNK